MQIQYNLNIQSAGIKKAIQENIKRGLYSIEDINKIEVYFLMLDIKQDQKRG